MNGYTIIPQPPSAAEPAHGTPPARMVIVIGGLRSGRQVFEDARAVAERAAKTPSSRPSG